jgi:2-polyprenyl-3-methyl-5-hydroxy-6-metoxy-1,4-benzoquinol methylase
VRSERVLDRCVPQSWRDSDFLSRWVVGSRPSYDYLSGLMQRYRVDRLVGVDPETFRKTLEGYVNGRTGIAGPQQRDLSVRFHWGHTHDFGSFRLSGRMGNRHLTVLSVFMGRLHALPRDLQGLRVLDIGCWTGGTSLLLAAMGADVVAIEEVPMYVEALNYLVSSFGVSNLHPRVLSLFDLEVPEFQDRFDLVLFSGVIYHLTDPVLGLRLVFDTLHDGGTCLLETAANRALGSTMTYEGPTVATRGRQATVSRGGWNWFVPSRRALISLMADVGFGDVRTVRGVGGRLFATGRRTAHVDIMRAGLSRPRVR